jgi:hypothetical protein
MAAATLDALRSFDRRHRSRAGGLSGLGLILLDPPQDPWGEDTPRNCRVFAHTGGDSVHYCLLDVGHGANEQSPVVMVVPGNSDDPRLVVGDSLAEFLALGSVIGFFFLEGLVYDRKRTLGYLFSWPAFIEDCYFGKPPPSEDQKRLHAQQEILRDLSSTFGLVPWADPQQRLAQLQAQWSSALKVS